MSVCVCMCVHVRVCMRVRVWGRRFLCACVSAHASVVCVYIHNVNIQELRRICWTCSRCARAHVHLCACVCVYVCMRVHPGVVCVCIYTINIQDLRRICWACNRCFSGFDLFGVRPGRCDLEDQGRPLETVVPNSEILPLV